MRKYFPKYEAAVSHNMTLQLLHSEFPYLWGKFDFLFFRCEFSGPSYSEQGVLFISCSFSGEGNLCLCCWEYRSCTPHHTSAGILGQSMGAIMWPKPFFSSFPSENCITKKDRQSRCWYQDIFSNAHKVFTFPQVRKIFRYPEGEFLHSSCRKRYGWKITARNYRYLRPENSASKAVTTCSSYAGKSCQ